MSQGQKINCLTSRKLALERHMHAHYQHLSETIYALVITKKLFFKTYPCLQRWTDIRYVHVTCLYFMAIGKPIGTNRKCLQKISLDTLKVILMCTIQWKNDYFTQYVQKFTLHGV